MTVFKNLQILMKTQNVEELFSDNLSLNILKHFDLLLNFSFNTSETGCDY